MRKNATVKVNVAWDESDYQLDVATAEGRAEYDRIFASNAALGITHVVYEPQNSAHASRFNTTDNWGWEAGLWFSLGEAVRCVEINRWFGTSRPNFEFSNSANRSRFG